MKEEKASVIKLNEIKPKLSLKSLTIEKSNEYKSRKPFYLLFYLKQK